jgi:uncharacterized protein
MSEFDLFIPPEYGNVSRKSILKPQKPKHRPQDAPEYFHLLAKPTGAICNLDCKYCFFLSKEELYPGSRFRMTHETLENYIRQMIESHSTPELSIAWQGGEPTLMGLEFFQLAMEIVQKYAPQGSRIEHTMQTNGTRLDDAWCEFYKSHNFLIGLSLDGPKHLHDVYRVDKAGRGTFDQVMKAARLLQQHQVEFNILCTVHSANAEHPLDVYHFFKDEVKTQFIQFIPIVERVTPQTVDLANRGWGEKASDGRPLYKQEGNQVTERSVTSIQWGKFLSAIFDEWVRRDVGKVYVQMFDAALASWLGGPPGLCIFAETCGNALALEHNGDLYSCDHFVEPGFFLGNINQEHLLNLVSSEKQRKFGMDKKDTLPTYCRRCEVRFACQGECPRNRFILTPDGEPGLNYLCAGYKYFFKHIDQPMRIMAELLKQGRAPAGVMNWLAMEDLKKMRALMENAKPDQPCPCGSGLIFRKCHGTKAATKGKNR